MFKKIDLDSFQENISNIERVIGVIKEMVTKEPKKETYKPRPIYKHFED